MFKKVKIGAVVLGMLALMAGLFFWMIPSSDAKRFWMADGLVSDGSSGQSRYIDAIHSGNSNLAHGDYAMLLDGGTSDFALFVYNSGGTSFNSVTSGTSRPFTVVPRDDPATGFWREVWVSSVSGYVPSGSTIYFGSGATAPSIWAVDNVGLSSVSAYICSADGAIGAQKCADFGSIIDLVQ
ncbi:hypothetical protein LCGC14_2802820 [marine sediment metagenome]|uniref:Uncharacterized protein n=1 Tax=marine sediment metagenome TaxID=412755 RepID=A0A0F9BDK4_9ZZZZ